MAQQDQNNPASVIESPADVDSFVVFDGTLYRDKPDFQGLGLQPIHIVYGGRFWKKGINKDKLPEIEVVRKIVRQAAGEPIVCFDIEHWDLRSDDRTTMESVEKYRSLLNWARMENSGIKYGYYGVPPIREYWPVMKGIGSSEYKKWQELNDRIKPLANSVDILFPSLYTFYQDREGWVKYAIAQISEARRYDPKKKIYVFLWPQYHNSNRLLAYSYLPDEYWKLQLETVRQYADGIVIWGGWDFDKNARAAWDEEAPWWRVTKQFLKDQNRL